VSHAVIVDTARQKKKRENLPQEQRHIAVTQMVTENLKKRKKRGGKK
jgi:hypothetical protein